MAAKKNEGKNLNVDASSSRVGAIPELIGLCRAIPFRAESSIEFDRTKVTCAADLPDYLMLGKLDHSACKFSKAGWSARWQGRENDTHFDIKYEAVADRYEIRQKWSGVDGGLSMYPARIPLGALISQSLYLNFPKGWDVAAKKLIESKYQVTYIEHPEQLPVVIGMPDGAMRAIAITLGAHQLRDFHNRLLDITARCRFPFPVMALCATYSAGHQLRRGKGASVHDRADDSFYTFHSGHWDFPRCYARTADGAGWIIGVDVPA